VPVPIKAAVKASCVRMVTDLLTMAAPSLVTAGGR
jgi:hypothetical protein